MAKIQADLDKMEKAAQVFLELAEEYKKLHKQLFSQVEDLAKDWEAPDHLAFVSSIKDFEPELVAMAGKLEKAGENLRQQKENYGNRISENETLAKKLPG